MPQRHEELLVVRGRAAQVGLGLQISSGVWTAATLRSGDWRHSFSMPSGLERVAHERRAVVLGAAVGVAPARDLVRDAVLGDGRLEPVRRSDQPVDHEAAVAQAEDPETLRVGEAEFDHMIDRGEDVGGIDAAPVAELRPDPVPAVRGRAADVRQDDAVARGDEEDDLDVRGRCPGAERPAMDIDDRGEGLVAGTRRGGDHVSIGPAGPGTSKRRISGIA